MFVSEDRPSRRNIDLRVNRINATQGATLCYGRFMQTDPVGYEDGMNMYDYVGGDPVNKTDPTGQVADIIVIGKLAPIIAPKVVAAAVGVVTGVAKLLGSIFGGGKAKPPKPSNNSNNTNQQEQPKRTQQPTACQKGFLKAQLASRGLPNSQIDRLTFISGLDGNANAATRLAFPNAGAVTQGATVYVQPNRFNEIANFRSPVGFEEAYHSGQFALYGAGGFYSHYSVMSAGASIFGMGARSGNLIEQFAEGASKEMYNSYQSFTC